MCAKYPECTQPVFGRQTVCREHYQEDQLKIAEELVLKPEASKCYYSSNDIRYNMQFIRVQQYVESMKRPLQNPL